MRDSQRHAARYYQGVKFALDVSQARFSAVEALYGIPTYLVKRDPDTQFVLMRTDVPRIKQLQDGFTFWTVIANELIRSEADGVVVVLGQKSRKYRADLDEANRLRAAGALS